MYSLNLFYFHIKRVKLNIIYLINQIFIFYIICFIISTKWNIQDRCLLPNNYIFMEITRPLTNCKICSINNITILNNPSRQEFDKYAYSGKPVLVKDATKKWPALQVFNYEFFKNIYTTRNNSFENTECQFLPFKTKFLQLSEVFLTIKNHSSYSKSWYVGWSNCNEKISQLLRNSYRRPSFLPKNSESSVIDWIFMGSSGQGSSMHLDYVNRPSWQAQISGSKTWRFIPTPECEKQCNSFNITVEKGDIILVDTNQWYHDTYINPGEMSISVGSEYD